MIIENYKIKLVRLNRTHLNQLRIWRNSKYVQNQMFYQDHITSKMQKDWFEKLDQLKNYYFIAYYENMAVGVIHVKNIEHNTGEAGIFLIDDKFENSVIVPKMVVCFNDFIFYHLKLDYIWSKVKRINKKAISSSLAQGCLIDESQSTEEIIYFKQFILVIIL